MRDFLCALWKYLFDRHGVLRPIQSQQLTAAVTIVAIAATPPSKTVNRRNARPFLFDVTLFQADRSPLPKNADLGPCLVLSATCSSPHGLRWLTHAFLVAGAVVAF